MSRKTRRRTAKQFRRSDRNLKAQHRRPRACRLQHDAHVQRWYIAIACVWCMDPEDWTDVERELASRPIPPESRTAIARLC